MGSVVAGALWITASSLPGATADAQTLNVPVKFTYKGTVIVRASVYASGTCQVAYTVPAGVSFRITDFMLANEPEFGRSDQYLCSGASPCETHLTNYLSVPATSTLAHNYTAGPRLDAGAKLFVCNGAGNGFADWTING